MIKSLQTHSSVGSFIDLRFSNCVTVLPSSYVQTKQIKGIDGGKPAEQLPNLDGYETFEDAVGRLVTAIIEPSGLVTTPVDMPLSLCLSLSLSLSLSAQAVREAREEREREAASCGRGNQTAASLCHRVLQLPAVTTVSHEGD